MRSIRHYLKTRSYSLRLFCALLVLSILTGLGGILLHHVLEIVELLAFGHAEDTVPFLTDDTSWFRRGLVLLVMGILSALVWYSLQKKHPILSIKGEIGSNSKKLYHVSYFARQLLHILWQIIAVGAGAPVGKEGAPRELGALLASPVAHQLDIKLVDRRVLIACGAGAGLAAVYQVPFTSIFFVFETLKVKCSLRNLMLVGLATYVSAYTARLAIPADPLYHVASASWSGQDIFFAIFLALVLAPLALIFSKLTKWVSSHRVKDRRILWTLPLAFLFLAVLSGNWSHLLGNGSMMAQEIFDGVGFQTAGQLFILKMLVVLLILGAGAYGGTLTPSFALGATAASLMGSFFPALMGGSSSVLLLGAVAFLAVTLQAPLSAVGLVIGFTGQSLQVLPYFLVTALLAYFWARGLDSLYQKSRKKS